MKVLLLDPLPEGASFPNFSVDENFSVLSEAQLTRIIGDYHVVCLSRNTSECILTDEVLKAANKLMCIGFFGSLNNQIDLKVAAQMGIPVFTAPYQHQTSTCELTISMIVLLARQLGDRSKEIHSGFWNKTSNNCHEVRGKTLGIVGYGRAGSQLGIMAESLSLRVIFYDMLSVMPIGRAEACQSLDSLIAQSDFISINIPPVPENAGLFRAREFALMKKGSYFINLNCAPAVDYTALASALKSGHLAGAALDVFPSYPESSPAAVQSPSFDTLSFSSPLQNLPNVILTPSISAETVEAFARIVSEVTSSIKRYIESGQTTGSVNFPSIALREVQKGECRIACIHNNVRGMLREIDSIFSKYNVRRQVLDTKDSIGYVVADLQASGKDQVIVYQEILSQLAGLANTVRTRVIA